MGKGTIISGGAEGQYQVQINYARDKYTYIITELASKITEYEGKISAKQTEIDALYIGINELNTQAYNARIKEIEEKTVEKNTLTLINLSFEKKKQYLENNMLDDETILAWCADLTEDLSGEVGLIEIPGEPIDYNIQPGYDDNAAYDSTRDGQLMPTVVQTSAQTFYNLAMLPGWQKWMPTYRYGTITVINGDKANVSLDSTTSSQQSIKINQADTLSNVDIEYMTCDGAAFDVGDDVLIQFVDQDFTMPKIIGFKEHPKGCGKFLYITLLGNCIIVDLNIMAVSTSVTLNSGGIATFPVAIADISVWLSAFSVETNSPLKTEAVLNPNVPIFPPECTTGTIEDLQNEPGKVCNRHDIESNCSLTQTVGPDTDSATYVAANTSYESSIEDFFLDIVDNERFFPFGVTDSTAKSNKFVVSSIRVNSPRTLYGRNELTRETVSTDECKFNPDSTFVAPCGDVGWTGTKLDSESIDTYSFTSPFEPLNIISLELTNILHIYRINAGGSQTYSVTSLVETISEHSRFVGGVLGSVENKTPHMVAWYFWRITTDSKSGGCDSWGPVAPTCEPEYGTPTITEHVDRFEVFHDTTTNYPTIDDPKDFDPFTLPKSPIIKAAMTTLCDNDVTGPKCSNITMSILY